MSRAPRTTKKQKECLVAFLEENNILLGGKFNPVELPKINSLWAQLGAKLNVMGPPKTIRQWKDTISEMKTNVRRRARDVRYGHRGTGGGPAIKPLTDLEERILSLISSLTIEGATLEEAGGWPNQVLEAGQSIILRPETDFRAVPSTSTRESELFHFEEVPHVELEIIPEKKEVETPTTNKENNPPIKTNSKTKSKLRRRLQPSNNRVDATIKSHDRQLMGLTKSNFAIAKSINNLARAVNNVAYRWK